MYITYNAYETTARIRSARVIPAYYNRVYATVEIVEQRAPRVRIIRRVCYERHLLFMFHFRPTSYYSNLLTVSSLRGRVIFLTRSRKDLLTQPELNIVSRQKYKLSRGDIMNYLNAIYFYIDLNAGV